MIKQIGRYELLEEIGRGGMSTVYLARDTALEREVALKLMPHQMALDKSLVARFEREAKLIARLDHAHIVSIYDVGTMRETGQPYLVMRLLRGGTLHDFLATNPSIEELCEVFRHIASALDVAHENGIVHRDIKPTNILFDNNQHAFLSDFGIAKLSDATTRLTGKALIGTPAYMSPELCRGDNLEITGQSDQYGFAIVVYEVLAGELPFVGDTIRVMYQHLNEPPPSITQKRADLPPLLAEVLSKALSKQPTDRYATVQAFVSALEEALIASGMAVPLVEKPKVEWQDTLVESTKGTESHSVTPLPPQPNQKASATEKVIPVIERDYQNGLAELEAENWSEAIALFNEVIRRDSRYKDALAQRRKAQNYQRRVERASLPQRPALASAEIASAPRHTTGSVAQERERRTTQNISRGSGGTETTPPVSPKKRKLIIAIGGLFLILVLLALGYGLNTLVGNSEEEGDGLPENTELTEETLLIEPTRSQPTNTPLPTANLSPDVQIYGEALFEIGDNNNVTIVQGKLVVESAGSEVTIANPYGEQARLLGTGVMGVEYIEEPLAFAVHCFMGDCYVAGSVDGEQPLVANEAVVVGVSGRPGEVFAARNDEFSAVAAVVPAPTQTPEPTNTVRPLATRTAAPTAIFTSSAPTATSTPTIVVDTDGDGIPDNEDNCPTVAGNAEDNPGCPFSREQTESGIGGSNEGEPRPEPTSPAIPYPSYPDR